MGMPTFADATDTAKDAVSSARHHGRNLLPWLPDPPACPACGALCYASATFDPRQAFHVTTWHCRDCDEHYPREPEFGPERLDGPSEGAPAIRGVLRQND